MKYNRREIMRTAWYNRRRFGLDMKTALRRAWYEARKNMPIHAVVGMTIYDGRVQTIRTGLTYEQAAQVQYMNQYRYDRVEIVAA